MSQVKKTSIPVQGMAIAILSQGKEDYISLTNMALFGQTAQEWRAANLGREGNMRDNASVVQLLVRANLESLNAKFIHMSSAQSERLQKLNQAAIRQLQSLTAHLNPRQLGAAGPEGSI